MGAVSFSLDTALVETLKQAMDLSVFVETGTFEGDTVAAMIPYFERIMSVELSEPLWKEATRRFSDERKVVVHHGDSAKLLADLRPSIGDASTVYWLDSHWCVADHTSGEQSQCPLLGEIHAIGSLNEASIVLIDDARLFLAPPPEPHDVSQWPSFQQVLTALREVSDRHELMVVNDVIAFFPPKARRAVIDYARKYGIDWLRASQSLAENPALRQSLEEKQAAIEELSRAISDLRGQLEEKESLIEGLHQSDLHKQLEEKESLIEELHQSDLHKQLEEKEAVIKQQSRALKAYRSVYIPLAPIFKSLSSLVRRTRGLLMPRLGNLYQYAPRPVDLPESYNEPIQLGETPKISIVTPSYKQKDYIERTIKSVLDQNYPNLEYYVQDGGSKDGTLEILQRYDDPLTGWDSGPDSGQSQAINRGFEHTDGEIMAWLNSDDILLPGALAYVANYFNLHPEVDVVYGHRIMIDEQDRQVGRWIVPAHDDKVLSWADYVPQETMFWRRRIWERTGARVDESFRFAMDWDLIVRFRNAGARFARLDRFLGGFRVHPEQKTSAAISDVGFHDMDVIRERELGRVPSRVEVRKAVMPYLVRHVAVDLKWRIQDRLSR